MGKNISEFDPIKYGEQIKQNIKKMAEFIHHEGIIGVSWVTELHEKTIVIGTGEHFTFVEVNKKYAELPDFDKVFEAIDFA